MGFEATKQNWASISFLSEKYDYHKVDMDMGSFPGQNLGDSNTDPVVLIQVLV